MSVDTKHVFDILNSCDPDQISNLSTGASIHLSAPFDRASMSLSELTVELNSALDGLSRRNLLWICGQNRRSRGGFWAAGLVHYVGNFNRPLMGLQPSSSLVFLRSGEFYEIDEQGRIRSVYIILDLIDLMFQTGFCPVSHYGNPIQFPNPLTLDGVGPRGENGEDSLDRVEGMLESLRNFDPESFDSAGQTGKEGFWSDDLCWYGPGGIGSSFRWEGFVKDHREPFLTAFPDRVGGDHYCRIGQGNYAAVSGWPSMIMTWQGPYFGKNGDGRSLTLRVMDFYRLDARRQIAENWVCLDYLDLARQMGRDLISESNARRALDT